MSRPRRPGSRRRADGGAVTPFVLVLCVALVALLGLVADGGRALAAREAAMTEAEQAARLGADQLSLASLHAGSIVVSTAAAVAAAEAYMAAEGHRGTAAVVGGRVVATVDTYPLSTPLLALVGIDSVAVGASASATTVDG